MTTKRVTIDRKDLKVGDTIVQLPTTWTDDNMIVERGVQPFAFGTVVQNVYSSDALFFRSTRGWVNRFGSEIDTDDAWFRENSAEYPVVYTPEEA